MTLLYHVQVFGSGRDFEVSAIREDNLHGQRSWGWPSSTKLIFDNTTGLTVREAERVADFVCRERNPDGHKTIFKYDG